MELPMLKSLAVLSVLAIGTAAAHASPITGTISADGADYFTSTTITFSNPAIIFGGSGANTGSFSVLADLTPIDFFPASGGVAPYLMGQNAVPATLFAPNQTGIEAATTTSSNGETFDFFMTNYDAAYGALPGCAAGAECVDFTGVGYWTESGGPDLTSSPGSFVLSSQLTGTQTSTTFSASAIATPVAVAPEPASLALVGSGLIGLAAFARRRGSLRNATL
jgi:hypothetical protein